MLSKIAHRANVVQCLRMNCDIVVVQNQCLRLYIVRCIRSILSVRLLALLLVTVCSIKNTMANWYEGDIKPEMDKLSKEEFKRLVQYINEETDYKVVTDTEYDLIKGKVGKSKGATLSDNDADKEDGPPSILIKGKVRSSTTAKSKGAILADTDEDEDDGPTDKSLLKSTLYQIEKDIRHSIHISKVPPFSGENKSGEVTFDVWKYEVKCIIREGNHSKPVVLQAIRNSLRGKARSLIVTLPDGITPQQMVEKLDGVYGNVSNHEAVMENFYKQRQEEGETLADFGMRLESLIQVPYERKKIFSAARNEMLCSKFFTGIRDPMLQNAVRYKYDTIKDFDTFRKEIRAVEQQTSNSNTAGTDTKKATVNQHSVSMQDILKKLDRLSSKVESVESELRSSRQDRRDRYDTQREDRHDALRSHRGGYNRGYNRGFGRGYDRGGYNRGGYSREGYSRQEYSRVGERNHEGNYGSQSSQRGSYGSTRGYRGSNESYRGRGQNRGRGNRDLRGRGYRHNRDDLNW